MCVHVFVCFPRWTRGELVPGWTVERGTRVVRITDEPCLGTW